MVRPPQPPVFAFLGHVTPHLTPHVPISTQVRPPQPPVFLFLVDVSYTAVASGMLRCVSATIKHTLARLPGGERTQVGLITYDSALQFYNLAGSAPQMLVVPEVRARRV